MYRIFGAKVDEQTPLFLSVPDANGDFTADELCLSARHEPPFAAVPGSPLTLTYFLCSADDVRKVCGPACFYSYYISHFLLKMDTHRRRR